MNLKFSRVKLSSCVAWAVDWNNIEEIKINNSTIFSRTNRMRAQFSSSAGRIIVRRKYFTSNILFRVARCSFAPSRFSSNTVNKLFFRENQISRHESTTVRRKKKAWNEESNFLVFIFNPKPKRNHNNRENYYYDMKEWRKTKSLTADKDEKKNFSQPRKEFRTKHLLMSPKATDK